MYLAIARSSALQDAPRIAEELNIVAADWSAKGIDNDVHALPPTSRAQRVLPTSSLSREQITSSNSADQYAFLWRRKKGAGGPEATAMLPMPGIWEGRFCWFSYARSCWGLYIGSLILDCVAAPPGTACILHLLYQLEASPRICLGL